MTSALLPSLWETSLAAHVGNNISTQINQLSMAPLPVMNLQGQCEIALVGLTIPVSWYNISAAYGNNQFQYTFPNAGTHSTNTVVVPDGSFSISALNDYLISAMLANGHYLSPTAGNTGAANIYFLNLQPNSVYGRTELTSTPVPTSLPTGYQIGGGSWSLPTSTAVTPQLVVPSPSANSNYSFSSLIGFTAGSYPATAQATTYTVIGQSAPMLNSVQVVQVLTDGCRNEFQNSNGGGTLLYAFSPCVPYGYNQIEQPQNLQWVNYGGSYPVITFRFVDQWNVPLAMQNPAVMLKWIVRQKPRFV